MTILAYNGFHTSGIRSHKIYWAHFYITVFIHYIKAKGVQFVSNVLCEASSI